jgi:acyl carrier protein
MVDQAGVFNKVKTIFVDVMDLDAETLTEATSPDDVEAWDSLNHVRLIMSLEKAFNVKFTNAEIGRLRTVGDFAERVTSKRL